VFGFIAASIIAFASTNIDNMFIMMLLFAQVVVKLKKRHIVIGQYLGLAILVFLSLLGAFWARFIPQKYICLLGLLPIALGVKSWSSYRQEIAGESATHGMLGADAGVILSIAFVAVAGGADNIGVYIPLFAGYSTIQLIAASLIFVFCMAFWCFLADRIAGLPKVKGIMEKYRKIAVPLIFIFLGIYIIIKNI
jgi:cadmium resistance transport/sequestration family protein